VRRPGPEDLVKRYENAANRHSVDESLGLFAADAWWTNVGASVYSGREEIRNLLEWDSVVNTALQISITEIAGDTAMVAMVLGDDWFRELGIDTIHATARIIFRDTLIHDVRMTMAEESQGPINAAIGPFVQWVLQERREEFLPLVPNQVIAHSAENAEKWLVLFRAWHEASAP